MEKLQELSLRIDGMHCASCVADVEKNLTGLDGVDTCSVNLAMRSAKITYDAERQTVESISGKIKTLGFVPGDMSDDVFESNRKNIRATRDRFLLSAILSVPLMFVSMWPMIGDGFLRDSLFDGSLAAVIALAIMGLAGREIYKDAIIQLRHARANMNSLIAMGTLTAFGWSVYHLTISQSHRDLYLDSVGMIVTLVLMGRFFEARTRGKAGQAIQALIKLRPSSALAIINDVEEDIDADSIEKGMILIIRPGERLPADGTIIEGLPNIDESMLTGESIPVEKRPSDRVIGGSLNGNVPFRMTVTAANEESTLASIVRTVSEAQSRKAPIQVLADRVASRFAPVVLLIAMITIAAWSVFDPGNPLMIKSVVSVLIIACPCALGLATPTAVLAGTGRAARAGIIIRGGDVLEKLNQIDTIVFDKTGTLTHGDLTVIDIRGFDRYTENMLLRLVGSVEILSEHPVAVSIVAYMKNQAIKPIAVKNVKAHPGFGLTAEYEGREILIGSRSLMMAQGISLGQAETKGEEHMRQGRTVVFAAEDDQVIGLIALSDRLRGEARELVTDLKKWASQVMMLSGDNRKTAKGVAKTLGLDSYEAEIRPEQKHAMIRSLRKAGFKVAMVGDGINDAPALAAADIGVAIGSGADIALETADIVLVKPDLSNIRRMFELGQQSYKTIKANLFWALFYNVIAIPIAAGLLYPLTGLTLSPVIAAGAMAFSSVFVVSNSLRLSQLDLK